MKIKAFLCKEELPYSNNNNAMHFEKIENFLVFLQWIFLCMKKKLNLFFFISVWIYLHRQESLA
jgi:hypothetical protein